MMLCTCSHKFIHCLAKVIKDSKITVAQWKAIELHNLNFPVMESHGSLSVGNRKSWKIMFMVQNHLGSIHCEN